MPHLRHEPAQPRTELHAFRVELNRRAGLAQPALRVVERLLLDVLLQVAQRLAQRSARPFLRRRLCLRDAEAGVRRRHVARFLRLGLRLQRRRVLILIAPLALVVLRLDTFG